MKTSAVFAVLVFMSLHSYAEQNCSKDDRLEYTKGKEVNVKLVSSCGLSPAPSIAVQNQLLDANGETDL